MLALVSPVPAAQTPAPPNPSELPYAAAASTPLRRVVGAPVGTVATLKTHGDWMPLAVPMSRNLRPTLRLHRGLVEHNARHNRMRAK